MCEFCDREKILYYVNKHNYRNPFTMGDDPDDEFRKDVDGGASLAYDAETNTYDLWVDVGDYFYSDSYLCNLKFCPMCGRKLDGEEVPDETSD